MPNWPRNSRRAPARSSRLAELPMVARNRCASASVSPMPESVTDSTEPSSVIRISAGASGSACLRAVMASTAFCSSSRTNTRGLE